MSVNKYNPTSGRLEPIAGGTLYADAPIGAVIYTYETEERDDWLFVRGQTLSREEYSGLFNWAVSRNLVETTAGDGKPFGLGDGSTTFTLPNLNGEFVRVTGTNSHTDQGDGGTIGQHQDATEQPNFSGNNGSFYFDPSFSGNTKNPDKTASGNSYQYFANASTGSQTIVKSFSTRPTNTSLNAMIKAKQTPVPADFISEVDAVTADLQDDIDQLQIEVDQLPKGVVPKGTVTFANLPSLASVEIGWMYNVSDAFTTTSDFVTPGIPEGASSNVYCINTGTDQSPVKKWDVFAAAQMILPTTASTTVGAMWLVE